MQAVRFMGADDKSMYIKFGIAPISNAAGYAVALLSLGLYVPDKHFFHVVCGDSEVYHALKAKIGGGGEPVISKGMSHLKEVKGTWKVFTAAKFDELLYKVDAQRRMQVRLCLAVFGDGSMQGGRWLGQGESSGRQRRGPRCMSSSRPDGAYGRCVAQ